MRENDEKCKSNAWNPKEGWNRSPLYQNPGIRSERVTKYVRIYVKGLHEPEGGLEPKPSLSESGDTLRESDQIRM